jgi:hypothetical protein
MYFSWSLSKQSDLIQCVYLIVFRHCDDEENGVDAFKAVKPLLSFGPLTADVDQVDADAVHVEVGFNDSWLIKKK